MKRVTLILNRVLFVLPSPPRSLCLVFVRAACLTWQRRSGQVKPLFLLWTLCHRQSSDAQQLGRARVYDKINRDLRLQITSHNC
jgi:hypothetical protein